MNGLEQLAEKQVRSHLGTGPSPERLSALSVKIGQVADSEIKLAHLNGPAVACRAGCSHCCRHHFVTAIIPEVLHLAATIKTTYTPERFSLLEKRLEGYMAEVAKVPKANHVRGVKSTCPVLENDLCGAFEARPLACRQHNSVDVDACIQYKDGLRSIPALASAAQTNAGSSLLTGFAIGLRRSRLQEALVELIPALEIALRIPDAASRYLRGEPIFDSAIVAGYDPTPIRLAAKKSRPVFEISLDG